VSEPLVLDCRGQLCPRPIIELARRIHDVAVGGQIAVEADDPAAAADVAAWCRMRGHDYDGVERAGDGTPRYRVRRQH
jgi:tRNA 2-thiouridine synthesizing protein A